MSRKIVALVILCAVCSIGLISCGSDASSSAEAQHYGVEAKTVSFETLDEMEEYSELIVKAVRLEGEEPVITTSNGIMVSGFTFSQVEIEEIYKDSEGRYQTGDVITILENEVYDEDENIIYHIAGYNMMVEDNEYLLFLHYAETDGSEYYVASGVNYGTISLDDNNEGLIAYTDQTGVSVVDFTEYEDMWTEAVNKYIQ